MSLSAKLVRNRHLLWWMIPVSLVMVLTGLWGIWAMGGELWRQFRLNQSGIPIEAEITGRWQQEQSGSRGGSYMVYGVDYRFTLADGRTYSHSQTVSEDLYLGDQTHVTVLYVPDDPMISQVQVEAEPGALLAVNILAIFLLLICFGLVVAPVLFLRLLD